MPKVHAKERLYLDFRKKRVVKEGDPDAAFLLAPKGGVIPDRYLPLMEKSKAKEPPKTPTPEPVENRETRVPRKYTKRSK